MNEMLIQALEKSGGFAAVALAAVGSGIGTGIAGSAVVGAWKKCYMQNKTAPFLLMTFAGAPLSQTIYGFILMFFVNRKLSAISGVGPNYPLFLCIGILGGLALGVSAWFQGVVGAAAADAYAETEKGFANNLMVVGIVETVAIFAMGFAIVMLLTLK
jgi:V/A-type H+-transporting ATPase subunit K